MVKFCYILCVMSVNFDMKMVVLIESDQCMVLVGECEGFEVTFVDEAFETNDEDEEEVKMLFVEQFGVLKSLFGMWVVCV